MTKTYAEHLRSQVGKKVLCSFCNKKKKFNLAWKMSAHEKIVCEQCQIDKRNEIGTMTTI